MTREEIEVLAEEVKLECRRDSLPQVDALLAAGWRFELPGVRDEPWQWYWRSPPKRAHSKGRKYLSTNQAFMALQRQSSDLISGRVEG
jgi:hypothetical protein